MQILHWGILCSQALALAPVELGSLGLWLHPHACLSWQGTGATFLPPRGLLWDLDTRWLDW